MVQVLPEVPSFGKQFAQSLGAGISHGISTASDLAQRLALEKYKRGLDIQRSLAEIGETPGAKGAGAVTGQGSIQPQAQGEETFKVLSPAEKETQAKQQVRNLANKGFPTTYGEELQKIENQQSRIREQQAEQTRLTTQSEETFRRFMPDAEPEQISHIRKRAEALQKEGLSEADLEKRITQDAMRLKNQIASVKRSLPPKRLFTKMKEGFLGTGREGEKIRSSIKNKLKPLLDAGLTDTARLSLQEAGYAPEERESLISSTSDSTKKLLGELPDYKGSKEFRKKTKLQGPFDELPTLDETQKEQFGQNLRSILKAHPSENLILLRKEYEDRGVNWRDFKNEVDDLISKGEVELNQDQMKYLDTLDQPPLDKLGRFLHKLHLVGR